MKEKNWEINGNLYDEQTGISNYQTFENGIVKTFSLFYRIFGSEIMNKIDFYVDNATAGSGYTPISTSVLGKIVIIKLGIGPDDTEARVVYQFAHELTHVVFWAYFGMNKPRANDAEESICTAVSLSVLKKFHPEMLELYMNSAAKHSYCGYQNGVSLVKDVNYDLLILKQMIERFPY